MRCLAGGRVATADSGRARRGYSMAGFGAVRVDTTRGASWVIRTMISAGVLAGVALLASVPAGAGTGPRDCVKLEGAAAAFFDSGKLCRNVFKGLLDGSAKGGDLGKALAKSMRDPHSPPAKRRRRRPDTAR